LVIPCQDLKEPGGATLAIINKERTPLDDLADYVMHDEAGKILPQIAQRLKMG